MKILIYNKNIDDIEEIKPEELPDGAVVSFIATVGEYIGSESFFRVKNSLAILKKMSNIIIHDIPGYQKLYMVTDRYNNFISYDFPIRGKNNIWKCNHVFDFFCKNFNQTWEDEPWPVWVKINKEEIKQ